MERPKALMSYSEVSTIKNIGLEMANEAIDAMYKFAPANSAHEAYAIMLEEFDELWDHVKTNQNKRDIVAMRKEAIQIGAMALRFALDICDKGKGRV